MQFSIHTCAQGKHGAIMTRDRQDFGAAVSRIRPGLFRAQGNATGKGVR